RRRQIVDERREEKGLGRVLPDLLRVLLVDRLRRIAPREGTVGGESARRENARGNPDAGLASHRQSLQAHVGGRTCALGLRLRATSFLLRSTSCPTGRSPESSSLRRLGPRRE